MGNRSILIAEDDPLFRHVLQAWLVRWGYQATVAEDGQQAWDLLQAENAPKLVVLDWMMPGMDGPEVCRKLRARTNAQYCYVLLLTARSDKQDLLAGLEAGADDYLSKPFDASELRARLNVGRRILDLQDQLVAAQEALRFEATHDALSGIWNRASILQTLQREVERANRMRTALGVMMVDLDTFKKINDIHGHLAGDEVLRAAARRILDAVRVYDVVGRYGGEEFLVVAPGCVPPDLLQQAERIRSRIAEPMSTSAGVLQVTASIGVTGREMSQAGAASARTLVRLADEAMYRAKAAGKDRVGEAVPEGAGVPA